MGLSTAYSFKKASWPKMELISTSRFGAAETRRERLHVVERNQLILAHRDERRRRLHAGRVDVVQIDGFAQGKKGLRAIFLHVVVAAREQVTLDGKAESFRISHGRSGKAHGELRLAAIGRHSQRTRQLQTRRAVAARDRLPHDLAFARCAMRSTAPERDPRRSR